MNHKQYDSRYLVCVLENAYAIDGSIYFFTSAEIREAFLDGLYKAFEWSGGDYPTVILIPEDLDKDYLNDEYPSDEDGDSPIIPTLKRLLAQENLVYLADKLK